MKKLALYFVSFCWLFFVGCSDNSPTPTEFTVMFNTDGGSAVAEQTIEENKKATKPEDPTKDLYTFEGWYSDEALTTSFDFETPITANTTLYAKWTEKTFTVTYKSDASTEVGTEKVSQVTPTLTRNSTNSFLVEGKYTSKFFSDETKMTAFTFPKDLTASITIYVAFKDIVTPADSTALVTEVDNAIAADGNSADLNYINTEKVKNMNRLFLGVANGILTNKAYFNGDISLWNVSAVTNMRDMFQNAFDFNGDISKWNVSAVTNMRNMFQGASKFNGDISLWKVGAVTDMSGMFARASKFNSDISKWNVGAVTTMDGMFAEASEFNGDISKWNVGAVTDMSGMFAGASKFNSDISKWEVSSLIKTAFMFNNATAFDQDLDPWGDHLTLDDNGKFTSSNSSFSKASMFTGNPREDNPPSWY